MSNTQMNSITRIGRLVLNDIMLEGRGLLIAAASVTGAALLIFGVSPITVDADAFSGILFAAVLILGGCLHASGTLATLHRRDRAVDYLMLPATLPEKLISRLLQTGILYTVGTAVLCVVISLLSSGLRVALGRRGSGIFNPFTEQTLSTVLFYLVFHASFLCGSAYFRTRAFMKTVLVAVGFALLTALYVSVLGRVVAGNMTGINFQALQSLSETDWTPWMKAAKGTGVALWYASAPFFWGITYLRMREVEA
jgi:hypothetical protein